MNYPDAKQHGVIDHCSIQTHAIQPKISPSAKRMKEFEKVVKITCMTTPIELFVGMETQEPVRNMNSAFGHIGRVFYYANHIRNTRKITSDLGAIASMTIVLTSGGKF